jgi:hypothetical protein
MIISVLLLLFPLIYLLSFSYSIKGILVGDYRKLPVFFVVGLPIYITSLSILHLNGLDTVIPFFQYSKEVVVLLSLGLLLYRLQALPTWNWLDRCMMIYFFYTATFIFLPIGNFNLIQKLIAFKNISFFPFLYFIGRLINEKNIWISKIQKHIMLLAVAAAILLMGELLTNTHFQSITGYASFYDKYFLFDPTGNYGLSWTFEIEGGIKRFASFFANPLEHAASTLLTVAVLVISLMDWKQVKEPKLFIVAAMASMLSVVFALSRASLAGYLLVSYLFFQLIRKRKIIFYYHFMALIAVLVFLFFSIDTDMLEFLISTLNFTNSSSLAHLLEWVDGIEAILSKPWGMGLGESGRVAGALGLNAGGENQLIITGVQCGFPAAVLYISIIAIAIYQATFLARHATGRAAQLATIVFIIRVGLLIPLLTAAVESYLYVSYLGWFLTGLMSTSWSSLHNPLPVALKSLSAK